MTSSIPHALIDAYNILGAVQEAINKFLTHVAYILVPPPPPKNKKEEEPKTR